MRLISLALLVACNGPDVPPTIEIRAPLDEADFDGHAFIDVRVAVEDERNGEMSVEFFVDGELAGTATGDGCRKGCQITGQVSTEGLEDGEHVLVAVVTDGNNNVVSTPETVEEGAIRFSVFDVPYVDQIAVHDTQEAGLNGPDMEVEVHLLQVEPFMYLGCAALPDVQEDNLPFEDLAAPFIYNDDGGTVRYADIAFTGIQVVVIESDGGEHCPAWPELTDLFEDDVDQIYGRTPAVVDFSVLFNEESIELSQVGFTGLVLKKGRPVNAG